MDTFERRREGDSRIGLRSGVRDVLSLHADRANEAVSSCEAQDVIELNAAAARNGDRAALKQLFDRYSDRVYRIALLLVSNHVTAEAVTEEIFVRYFEDPPPDEDAMLDEYYETTFETWIFRSTIGLCIRNMEAVGAGAEESERLSIEEPDRATAIRRLIATALARLEPRARVALVLREAEGFSYEEIARFMGIRDVSGHLASARRALAGVLGQIEFEGWNVG